jgi:hypothetical protein
MFIFLNSVIASSICKFIPRTYADYSMMCEKLGERSYLSQKEFEGASAAVDSRAADWEAKSKDEQKVALDKELAIVGELLKIPDLTSELMWELPSDQLKEIASRWLNESFDSDPLGHEIRLLCSLVKSFDNLRLNEQGEN